MTESLDAFSGALTALLLVALSHPDPRMRATAERLLRIIFRAE